MGLGKQVADLGQGVDVPVRHIVLAHGLHPAVLKPALFHLALSDGLHDLEAHLGVQALGDQIQHDVVAAAHRLQNGSHAPHNQLPGVAHPHVRTVGKAGQAHQRVKILWLGVHQHSPGKPGVEFRDGHGSGLPHHVVVFIA
ncbi:hypothetical protein SDC9_181939 [bioreactor metagenome]|uniref:Uncharacterized protein n=1 Tax=bioreactor metagenome TaxID=1076179 RepID=A0A645H7H2_9ZZZZ